MSIKTYVHPKTGQTLYRDSKTNRFISPFQAEKLIHPKGGIPLPQAAPVSSAMPGRPIQERIAWGYDTRVPREAVDKPGVYSYRGDGTSYVIFVRAESSRGYVTYHGVIQGTPELTPESIRTIKEFSAARYDHEGKITLIPLHTINRVTGERLTRTHYRDPYTGRFMSRSAFESRFMGG